MSRQRFDQKVCEDLASCVKEIEATTDVELVIGVQARAGSYRHADYLFGAVVSFASLVFMLFAPWDFHLYWVAIDVAFLFGLATFLSTKSNAIRRLLTTENFRNEAVRLRAAAMFYEAGIANTDAEMGMLIYLSLLERRAEVIADRGVLKAVPPLQWNEMLSMIRNAGSNPQPDTFEDVIRKLGKLLAEHIPATGENPNELPDMPRFDLK
jgi:putative membrane protein